MTKLQRRLGKAVRRLRAQAGHSQEDFASVIGIHRTTMGRIERGAFNASLATLERLAKGLGISLSTLFTEVEGEGRSPRTEGSDRAP